MSSQNILNAPFDNPWTKAAFGVGIVWLGYIGVKHAKHGDQLPQRRRNRQGLTSGHIDKQIDGRNYAYGGKVPSNPQVPFYSRHNYNRRRRSKDFY